MVTAIGKKIPFVGYYKRKKLSRLFYNTSSLITFKNTLIFAANPLWAVRAGYRQPTGNAASADSAI